MSLLSTFGRPAFLRGFHGWATVAWFAASFPLAVAYGSSVVFVTFLSLYAIVTGHWSAWQSARVEVAQEEKAPSEPAERRCPQCDEPFSASACSPTHALTAIRLAAGRAA